MNIFAAFAAGSNRRQYIVASAEYMVYPEQASKIAASDVVSW